MFNAQGFKEIHVLQCFPKKRKHSLNGVMLLNPVLAIRPFKKWGINFVVKITPVMCKKCKQFVVYTNYPPSGFKSKQLENPLENVAILFYLP